MEVEREVVDLYRAFFLRDRIGDVFDGRHLGRRRASASSSSSTIRSSRGWSASRRCPTTTTSSTSRPAAWSGGARARTFALGDSVKVEVQSVSVVRRKIDFALAGHRARHHDSRGDRYGRAGRQARARREARPARREARPRAARPRARRARTSGAPTSRSQDGSRSATAGGGNRRRGKPKKRR